MAEIAILAAIEIGLAVGQALLAPHPKQTPVDRGRADDLRFTLVAEGTILPRFYGKRIRVGGVLFDGGRTKEIKSSTPGNSGGKKGQGGTPPTTNYSYQKTFGIVWGEGPIRSFREIKEDDTVIYNLAPDAPGDETGYYQAEDSANTLAGGATIVSDATCAGGRRVDLPPGASVQFSNIWKNLTETTAVVIYYKCTTSVAVTIRHNGVDDPTTAPNSSGALIASIPLNYSLSSGNNTIKITNTSGSATISIDRLFAFAGFVPADPGDDSEITGIKHPTLTYPTDLNNPSPFYNYAPFASGAGAVTGTLAAGGQSPFELFNGTEDQVQSAILMALPGRSSSNTPANRGLVVSAFQNYVISQNRQTLGNFTAEIEPWFSDLADILTDLYMIDGATAAELNFTAVAGIEVDGFIYDRRDALTPYVQALCDFYGFDVVPIDGKITAVLRGGAAVLTIPEDELYGREEGSEFPKGPIIIDHISDQDIPVSYDVIYLDPSSPKEFHTADRKYTRQLGNSLDPETLTFPLVTDADTAVAVAKRIAWERKIAAKPSQFSTGPRYRYLVPTDVINIQTSVATYRQRIIGMQPAFTGLVKFRGVPEKGALYSQVGSGAAAAAGTEIPPVAFPANTFLALLDLPPLRLEDDRLGYYRGFCPRGQGGWKGAHLYKEFVDGDYHHIDAEPLAANLGVLAANLSAITDTLAVDHSTSITIDLLYDDGTIASRTEEEILARPLNELVLGSGATAEVLRYATATPGTATAPYVARYVLTNLVRGLYGTEQMALTGHTSGKTLALITSAVKFIEEDAAEVRRARNYKAPTVGQALSNAAAQSFTFEGYSKKPLSVTGIKGYRTATGDAIIEWVRRARVAGLIRNFTGIPLAEEKELYKVEVLNGSSVVYTIWVEANSYLPVPFIGQTSFTVTEAQPTGGQTSRTSELLLDPFSAILEATLFANVEDSHSQLELWNSDYSKEWWRIVVFNHGADLTFTVYEAGVSKYSATVGTPVSPRFQIKSGILSVFDHFSNDATIPVFQSLTNVPDIGPLRPRIFLDYGSGISGDADCTKPIAARGQSAIYPAALQTAHFGSTQALGTLSVRITQYSALVGPGTPATGLV